MSAEPDSELQRRASPRGFLDETAVQLGVGLSYRLSTADDC